METPDDSHEDYEPTIFPLQKLNVNHTVLKQKRPSKPSEVKIPYLEKNVSDENKDILTSSFIAFLGRVCSTSKVHVGILHKDQEFKNESTARTKSRIYPAIFTLDFSECISTHNFKTIQKLKELEFRFTQNSNDEKYNDNSVEHNIVIDMNNQSESEFPQIVEEILKVSNMLMSIEEHQLRVFHNASANNIHYKHILEVVKHFPIFHHALMELTIIPSYLAPQKSTTLLDVPLVTNEDLQNLYRNSRHPEIRVDEGEDLLDMFWEFGKKHPNKHALISTEAKLTFRVVGDHSKNIARILQRHLPEVYKQSKRCVGLYLPSSLAYVVSMLGVVESKYPFLPLPEDLPPERLSYILKDSKQQTFFNTKKLPKTKQKGCLRKDFIEDKKTSAIITKIAMLTSDAFTVLEMKASILCNIEFPGENLILVTTEPQPSQEVKVQGRETNATPPITNDELHDINLRPDCCFVMYTSGSTGRPKGTQVRRKGVLSMSKCLFQVYYISSTDTVAQFSSVGFDSTIVELFPPLLAGATVAVLQSSERMGSEFVRTVNTLGVTMILLSPSVLNTYQPEDFHSLKKIISAGEVCTSHTALKWSKGTDRKFFNAYGPTEATVCCAIYEFNAKNHSDNGQTSDLPIGAEIPGARVYLFDDFMKPVPPGVMGEIFIGGWGVSGGYIGQASYFNATKYVKNPLDNTEVLYRTGDHAIQNKDGVLTFIGRLDDMIKLRGFRVDLAEIQQILLQHPDIEMAIVVKHKAKNSSDLAIAAFVSPSTVTTNEVRSYLSKVIPHYMIPTFIRCMDVKDLPRNLNGKVDKKKLETEEYVKSSYQTSRDFSHDCDVQKSLAKIWCEVLMLHDDELQHITPDSYFYDFGGNSLKQVLLQAQIEKELGVRVPFADLVEAMKLKDMADVVKRLINNEEELQLREHASESNKIVQQMLKDSQLNLSELLAPEVTHGNDDNIVEEILKSRQTERSKTVQYILLSGATGFLGSFLVQALMERTTCHLYCLVRAEDSVAGFNRLVNTLSKYKLWKTEYGSRITVVLSELTEPCLGIPENVYSDLSMKIDVVFMNAAMVNFNSGYRHHRTANVLSAVEFIKFALTGKRKGLFLTSSLNVLLFPPSTSNEDMNKVKKLKLSNEIKHGRFSDRLEMSEDDDIEDPSSVIGGYGQSKWVSEKLVRQALDVLPFGGVFRPGRITGDSIKGIGTSGDLFSALLFGMEQMGFVPDIEFPFDLTPVNFCARAMVEIMLQMSKDVMKVMPRVYHLYNTSVISFLDLFEDLPIKKVSWADWKKMLCSIPVENPLFPLIPFITGEDWFRMQEFPVFSTKNTDKFVSKECRKLMPSSEELLPLYKKYFKDLKASKR